MWQRGESNPLQKNKYQLNSITKLNHTLLNGKCGTTALCLVPPAPVTGSEEKIMSKNCFYKGNRSGGRTRTSLGTLPPLGIYRVSSQLLCKECCSFVGCIHCGVIGSPRSLSTCCIVGADHIRNANSHTRLECLLCATRCGRYAFIQYVNVLFVGRMGLEPIRIPYCLVSYS